MITAIHTQLREIRRDQRCRQKRLAAMLGITPQSLGSWERGTTSPFIHHAHAWAHTLHHQLVAIHNGSIIGALIDLLPTLPGLRRELGITQEALGRSKQASESAVNSLEARIRAGDRILLTTGIWYAAGLEYEVGLAPAVAQERAA